MTFLTSRTLIDNGGKRFVDDKDFSQPFDFENERMTLDFIIDSFEQSLGYLKSRETYHDRLNNISQVSSIAEYNQMNLNVLHLDEYDLLKKNLDYLVRARQDNLGKF